jgi:alpha-D-ribose 1-methylphosphonate 5-triphosphate synthase subunit PhnL
MMSVLNGTRMSQTPTADSPPAPNSDLVLRVEQLCKGFTLHHQGSIHLSVLQGVSLEVRPEECVAIAGASGTGKSTLLRSLYGNYRVDQGAIWVKHLGDWVNLPRLEPHELLEVRQKTIGYISQFLRVIPRVPALQVAAEPLLELGTAPEVACDIIRALFVRLNLPERLWSLSPTTFSGGEKQRVNIARAWSVPYPILLLDEPTSALDATNREVVMQLIEERRASGCALIGIFHDDEVRDRVCNRRLTLGQDD